eukprot:TRINITY_DN24001_c0_g1_i1.p1 TRINITY_DN24001_c0_g1~~TRINITY_DN24001_c0_g1_i1.p1  ORF type:complete len:233 (-),score=40.80 TRINITY_DN24001_c0_g1_i1:719-1417(-)
MADMLTVILSTVVGILGLASYACFMIAEADKVQQSTVPVSLVNGFFVCEYPPDKSIALSAAAVGCTFLAALLAHVASIGGLGSMKVFTSYHQMMVGLWYFFSLAGTVVVIIIGSYASWQQATHHRNATQQINSATGALTDFAYDPTAAYASAEAEYYGGVGWNDKGVLCPTVKMGIFGGMGFVAIGNMAMWIGFITMASVAKKQQALEDAGEFHPDESELNGAFISTQAYEA